MVASGMCCASVARSPPSQIRSLSQRHFAEGRVPSGDIFGHPEQIETYFVAILYPKLNIPKYVLICLGFNHAAVKKSDRGYVVVISCSHMMHLSYSFFFSKRSIFRFRTSGRCCVSHLCSLFCLAGNQPGTVARSHRALPGNFSIRLEEEREKTFGHNESSNDFQWFPYVLLTCKVFTKITLIKRRKLMFVQKGSLFWVRFNAHVPRIDLLHQSWSTFQTSHQFAELRRARGPHLDKASHLKPDGVQESKCGRKTLSIENIFVKFVKLLMFEELIC